MTAPSQEEGQLGGVVMMTLRTFTVFTALLLFSLGCKEPQTHAQQPAAANDAIPDVVCPNFSEVKPLYVLLILIDRSGSIQDESQDQLPRVQADAANLVQRLPPATVILGRYISAQSYRDAESFLADVIPGEPPAVDCVVTNPFDPVQKRRCQMAERRYRAQLQCVEQARKRITAVFLSLTPARAQRTDIWGGIAAASEIFSTYPASIKKTIIVYSDLADNVRTPLPDHLVGLEGAEVVVRTARTGGNPREVSQRVTAFGDRLSRWGAKMRSSPIDVAVNVDGIFNRQS